MPHNISRRSFAGLAGSSLAALGLAACGGKKEESKDNGSSTSGAADTDKVYKIGILQLTQHEALDASHKGFLEGLTAENVKYDLVQDLNASGDQSACQTSAQTIVNAKVDLILAIATPAVEAVAGVTETIPIVGTAVTDFAESHLIKSNDEPGGNITGTSDLTPVAEQFDLLAKLFPQAKNVGVLYCSAESNSKIQSDMAHKNAEMRGLTATDYTVSNTNEIQSVVESAVGKVDVLYCPTDNTIASGMATVAQICNEHKLPTIVGEVGMVEKGGLATYSIDYYELGRRAAKMAAKILKEGAKPATMPIETLAASECKLETNEETAKTLGVDLSVLKK